MPKVDRISLTRRYSVELDDGKEYIVEQTYDLNTCSEEWFAFDENGVEVEDENFLNVLISIVNS